MNTHLKKIFIHFVFTWICYFFLYSQQGDTLFIHRGKEGKIEFARFKVNENSDRKMNNDIIFLKSVLQAKEEDEFRLKSETTDEFEITHKRFQQYYNGVRVDNAEYLLHGKDGNIDYINGSFQIIDIQTPDPAIDEQQALKKALEYVDAEKYKWEDPNMESFIKQHLNNPGATFFPKGELVITRNNIKGSESFKLSWKFTISSLQPNNEQIIVVDASNGIVINDFSLISDTNVTGTAQTLYSNNQYINCDSFSMGYRLFENRNTTSGQSANIHTLNCINGGIYSNAIEFTNTNTMWTQGSWCDFYQDQAALDVHWGTEKVLDYWSNQHSRNSINGLGIDITSYIHWGNNDNNASWDGVSKVFRFGDGDGVDFSPLTAIDIVAHEIGHGISQFTANFMNDPIYNLHTQALNEGFSDIWGACVKHWATPDKPTWKIGSELFGNSSNYTCIRDMQNPKNNQSFNGGNPNTLGGQFWLNSNPGYGHTNSTILSHWFYLLCEGGIGINDNNNYYNVTGIGINKAEKIAYKTLLALYPDSHFFSARNLSIQAAINSYGEYSCEVVNVTNAWHAVGVGNAYSAPVTITSDTTWAGSDILLSNIVTVDNGAVLTITGNVYCTEFASIVVRPGSKLIIDGGLLTSACDNLWKGITVEGTDNQQLSQYQGTVELVNGTTIENTLCAVTTDCLSVTPNRGGIIYATDAVFRNNICAIEYKPYIDTDLNGNILDNVGSFTNCTFIIDSNNLFAANGLSFYRHINLWFVKGVKFRACTFNSILGGIGIHSQDAGYIIDNYCNQPVQNDCECPANYSIPCTFENLQYGIYSNNTGNPFNIIIDQSKFISNSTSVKINASNYYQLSRSVFDNIGSVGLRSISSSGYKIEENSFSTTPSISPLFSYKTGIEINNSGTAENKIYKNYFEKLDQGIFAKETNATNSKPGSGLQFLCNIFEDNEFDILVENTGKIRINHGNINEGADNKFYNTIRSSFYNDNSNWSILYFHSQNTNHIPFKPHNINIDKNAEESECASTFCLPIIINKSIQEQQETYLNLQNEYDNLVNEYNDLGYDYILENMENPEFSEESIMEALLFLSQIDIISNTMRELSDNSIRTIMQDSIMDINQLKSWYEIIRTPIAKYLLTETRLFTNDYEGADAILYQIPEMFEFGEYEMAEHENYILFHNFKKQLQLVNRRWSDLEEHEIFYLQTIAEANTGRSSTMAKGVLCFFFDICYEDEIEMFKTINAEGRKQKAESNSPETLNPKPIEKEYGLTIYPNPANNEIFVSIDNSKISIVRVELYDIFGKLLLLQNFNKTNGLIQISNFSDGFYVMKVYLSNGEVENKKVVKQKNIIF